MSHLLWGPDWDDPVIQREGVPAPGSWDPIETNVDPITSDGRLPWEPKMNCTKSEAMDRVSVGSIVEWRGWENQGGKNQSKNQSKRIKTKPYRSDGRSDIARPQPSPPLPEICNNMFNNPCFSLTQTLIHTLPPPSPNPPTTVRLQGP